MTNELRDPLASRIAAAAQAVFGPSPMLRSVEAACQRFESEVANITQARGIHGMLIAIVGAKGQGKTWIARQLVLSDSVRKLLRSGDLVDDATTRLVWIGPSPPDQLDSENEIYHRCASTELLDLGQPYTLLDTPGSTDSNPNAARIAAEALSLAPIKLLVVARDQIRSAASIIIAERIDGSDCIPIISSVEPEEWNADHPAGQQLQSDLRALKSQIATLAPRVRLHPPILVPDFEISGKESQSADVLHRDLVQRLGGLRLDELASVSSKESRLAGAEGRLRRSITKLIADELPQLSAAVDRLNQETENLPERVLSSLLGSPQVLETGVRMRLRTQLVADTYLLWFPYRTLMSTLNLTQGAWDRVVLALSGSVPSLFGALASWAKNVRQSREFSFEVQDGIRDRMHRQVEERLKPLCDQFHRTVMRLHVEAPKAIQRAEASGSMSLSGIEELQLRSRAIFENAIQRNATSSWFAQCLGIAGVVLFWGFMAGPIVAIYRQYFSASLHALSDMESSAEAFPHPEPSLIFTSVILSLLPLLIYAMLVLTFSLGKRKVQRVTQEIVVEHESAIQELRAKRIIQLQFEDRLLQQAEFLLNLSRSQSSP